jgi:hypothetical protein
MEWTLELVLMVLLLATLLQAIRLERALGSLKRDRASLEAMIAGFKASTEQAETGIQRLRGAIDGAGRQMEAQMAKSTSIKADLSFLIERGERIAERLDSRITSSVQRRSPALVTEEDVQAETAGIDTGGIDEGKLNRAERDLLAALRLAR